MAWLIAKYGTLFFWSTWKFLFAPTWGWNSGLSYVEIIIVHALGGWCGYMVFFYGASYFVKRYQQKQEVKRLKAFAEGRSFEARKFTWINKLSVRMKRLKYGYVVMMFLCASFAGTQVGAIVMARFYSHKKGVWLHALIVFSIASALLTIFWKFSKVL